MTILVVFGTLDKFGVDHGTCVLGNDRDCIYFAADKLYDTTTDAQILPHVTDEISLPVIQHNSGSSNHNSQLKWLKSAGTYNPTEVKSFSHDEGSEPFETIKRLLKALPGPADSEYRNQVSIFVAEYSNRAILQYMDNCAAWNALYLISELPAHANEMNKYMRMVQPFVSQNLNELEDNLWITALEKAAASLR